MFGMTNKNFQANHQNWWLNHLSCRCQRFGDQTIRTGNRNGGSSDRTNGISNQSGGSGHQKDISYYRTSENGHQCSFFGHRMIDTGRWSEVSGHKTLECQYWSLEWCIQPPNWWPSHQIGEGEATMCFCKLFYQTYKGKTFYNLLQKDFTVSRKYFTSLTTFYLQTNT